MKRTLCLLGLFILLAGCSPRPSGGVLDRVELDAGQLRAASRLYESLLAAASNGEVAEVRALGEQYLVQYPGAPDEDHVLLMTAEAAGRSGEPRVAERLLVDLGRRHPQSAHAAQGELALAALYEDQGRWLEEAKALVRADGSLPEGDGRRGDVRARLRELIEVRLDVAELDALGADHPRSIVSSTVQWNAVKRLHERDGDPDDVARRLKDFVREYPESRYVEDARAMLADLGRRHGTALPSDLAVGRADRIGLLCPLTGDYATLGQAMFDGALLAVEEHNRATGEDLQLVGLDTRGDEVVAVLQTRRLIEEENVIAVVGALLSSTTVAAATLCEERGVPMVSPTATKETIADLGANVFQTNLAKAMETQLLARVGARGMLRERYAILHPNTDEGAAVADRFAAEVERLGGRIVARASYDREVTDFGRLIRGLREQAPEALFVPATPTEMRLIAPQLVFHDLRAQLLGPSSWNNSLLIRETGESLEQAVIPSDVALIPESQRVRFEDLWRRRYPAAPSSAFGLKTYFAVRRVIDALQGGDALTRSRVRENLEAGLATEDGESQGGTMQRLRMVREGQILGLPLELLPGLTPGPTPVDREADELLEPERGGEGR